MSRESSTVPVCASQINKDRQTERQTSVFVVKRVINPTVSAVLRMKIVFLLSSPQDTCVVIEQMCRPSQTPNLTVF